MVLMLCKRCSPHSTQKVMFLLVLVCLFIWNRVTKKRYGQIWMKSE